MAKADLRRIEALRDALAGTTLAHCYLETLHRSIESSFEEIRDVMERHPGFSASAKKTLADLTSDGINLLYLAEEQAGNARRGADAAETQLYGGSDGGS